MTVIFRPQAVEDVVKAVSWYEAQVPGLGEQLIDEILRAARRAQENPELFRIVHRDGNFDACLQVVFLTGSSSRPSAKRSTSTRFFTERATIVDGRGDCRQLCSYSRGLCLFTNEQMKAQIGEWTEKSSSDETLRTKDVTSL